jgi:TonB family protein
MTSLKPGRGTDLAVLLCLALAAPSAADGGVEPFDSQTDRVPRKTVIPAYPDAARRDRIEGEVQVCFDISREGYPRRIAVRRSTHRLFERAAMKAVRQSSWQPLEEDKALPAIKACRTFRFSLVPVGKDAGQS